MSAEKSEIIAPLDLHFCWFLCGTRLAVRKASMKPHEASISSGYFKDVSPIESAFYPCSSSAVFQRRRTQWKMSDSDGYSGWKSTPESSTKVIWNGKTLLPEAKWHPTQWILLKNEQKMELEQYLRTLWKEVIEWLYKLVPPSLPGSFT